MEWFKNQWILKFSFLTWISNWNESQRRKQLFWVYEENNILHRPKRLCFNGSTNAFYAFLISKHDKERINHYRDSYFPPLRHVLVSLSTVLYTILQQSLPRSDIHYMPRTLFSSMLHMGRNISNLWSCVMSCMITKGFCYSLLCFQSHITIITKDDNVCRNEKGSFAEN